MSVHRVEWDCDTGRPIVDGMTTHPTTGAVQPRGRSVTYGPPTIDAIWTNVGEGSFRGVAGPESCTLDELYLRVAKHVEMGIYKLKGVNATPYAFYILCDTDLTSDEFMSKVFGFDSDPDQLTYTDEQGNDRKIYFPLERWDDILQFMRDKNLAELGKFPTSRDSDPDQLTYTDDQGDSRKIYFPLDRWEDILQFKRDKNWAELAKFPTSRQ